METLKRIGIIIFAVAALLAAWFFIFGRVPFDRGASAVVPYGGGDMFTLELSQEQFGRAPDTLYYSMTNISDTPWAVMRRPTVERLVDGQWVVLEMNLKNTNIADAVETISDGLYEPGDAYSNWVWLRAYGNFFRRGEYRLVLEAFRYEGMTLADLTEHVCPEGCEHIYMTAGFSVR